MSSSLVTSCVPALIIYKILPLFRMTSDGCGRFISAGAKRPGAVVLFIVFLKDKKVRMHFLHGKSLLKLYAGVQVLHCCTVLIVYSPDVHHPAFQNRKDSMLCWQHSSLKK